MYRKEINGIAVDNFKRKNQEDDDDEEEEDESYSESESEEPVPTNDKSLESDKSKNSNEIQSVSIAKSIPNKDDRNQEAGFNLFLQQIKKSKEQTSESSSSDKDKKENLPFKVFEIGEKHKPPSIYTVTSINQSKDLQRINNKNMPVNAIEQSSAEWLENNGLETLRLTIEDLISKGKVGNPRPDIETGEAINFLIYDEMEINEFEYKVHMAIELYSKRIKWCLQGSRKMFGLVGGSNVGVLIDCSDANLGFGRMMIFQEDLLHLLDEQLYKKHSLHVGFIGTNTKFLWDNPMVVNCRVMDEVKQAFGNLSQMGGNNLLQALKQIMRDQSLDKVLLILGSTADQDYELLIDFYNQLQIGRDCPSFHCVAYETDNVDANNLLKNIANISGGIYHRYSSLTEELIYTGNDIDLLLQEIESAQIVLEKIDLMRHGLFNDAISPTAVEIANEIKNLAQADFLPQPPSFHDALVFEVPKFQPKSSSAWLQTGGLKAKKLDLYSILSPNSYEIQTEFVPSIGKLVTSSVYEKAMIQVRWPDGSERNVHADLARLFEYQKLLGEQVKLMEQRINWLASGSRRLFGTIVEPNVVFILDLSLSNLKYLVHIQHSLKILIQQQLMAHNKFNFVAFNSKIQSFRPGMIKVSKENLGLAWEWIKTLQCSGSRNFMGGLKAVLESQIDTSHNDQPEGIYLFTSGVPDQNIDPLLSYIEERLIGSSTKIHTVLFNVDDYDKSGSPIPSRYANITKTAEIMRMIAHQTGGRFHWFRESGIIESDDIRTLMGEIDLAVEYSRRTQQIIQDFKQKYPDSHYKKAEQQKIRNQAEICRRESSDNLIALPPPRATSLSKARQQIALQKRNSYTEPVQIPYLHQQGDPMKSAKQSKPPRIPSAFYTEDGNSKGVVYNELPGSDLSFTKRKGIGKTDIPNKEDWISSAEWMKKYSLKNMGLNLIRLVSGPDCRHEHSFVVPIEKFAEAKYCSGLFPIVNVRGTRKHMQYTPTELHKYDIEARKALERYLRRLEWLSSGSKRIFGVIIEPAVTILLDTSGSMTPHMPELILNLKTLIWEQLFKRKISYNLVAFNSQIQKFRERIVEPDEVNCHSAIGWTEHLHATGNTDTLKAIQISMEDPRIQGIYLLTDGKPDNSTDTIIKSVMNDIKKTERNVPIHTISFNCEDETANHFLKELSRITKGRYHKVCHEYDVRLFSQRVIDQCQKSNTGESKVSTVASILSVDPYYPPLPEFHGDDLARVAKEIQLSRVNLSKTNYFRQLYYEMVRMKKEKQDESTENAKMARQQLSNRL